MSSLSTLFKHRISWMDSVLKPLARGDSILIAQLVLLGFELLTSNTNLSKCFSVAKAGVNTLVGNGLYSIVERVVMLKFYIFDLVCIFLMMINCQISSAYCHDTIAPMIFIRKTKIFWRLRTTIDKFSILLKFSFVQNYLTFSSVLPLRSPLNQGVEL